MDCDALRPEQSESVRVVGTSQTRNRTKILPSTGARLGQLPERRPEGLPSTGGAHAGRRRRHCGGLQLSFSLRRPDGGVRIRLLSTRVTTRRTHQRPSTSGCGAARVAATTHRAELEQPALVRVPGRRHRRESALQAARSGTGG
jgi:hypothetical protein